MTDDRIETLVREAFADEADRAVGAHEVLAAVRGRRPRRSYGLVLATAAVAVVVVVVATFVAPAAFRRSTPPAVEGPHTAATSVLVIGTDGRGNPDSILLVRIDGGAVTMVSLPRDSYVQHPAGAMATLRQVFRETGPAGLVTSVGDLTGTTLDHHMVVDMTAVSELAKTVGGVPVCLNHATSDPMTGADFPAGEQVVSGSAALAFIRQRHGLPNGDLDRIGRLQALLRSLSTTLRDTAPADLATWITALGDKVTTDPGLDVGGFVTDVVRATELRVGTIPVGNVELKTPTGAALEVDPARVRQFVTDLPGTPPATGDVPCVN